MANDHNYWRSLGELHDGKSVGELKAQEFMQGVTDDFDVATLSPMSRKRFLALLSASAAFAAAGCSNYRDKGEIVPYGKKPEEIIPGVPAFYASTCTGCAQACGILIKTREGRPIKVDGNPDHPVNRGKLCAKGQASVLDLYDPNRLRAPQYGSASGKFGDVAWKAVDEETAKRLQDAAARGAEIALLTGPVTSPTAARLLDDFVATYPSTRIYVWDPLDDGNRRRAWKRSYGTDAVPALDWGKAKVILALESDFLGTDGMVLEQVRAFAAGRDIAAGNDMARLYAAEGALSLTGANADYRIRLRPDRQLAFVLALARAAGSADAAAAPSLREFAGQNGLAPEVLEHLAADLARHRGAAIVHAGPMLAEEVHVAVNHLNEVLGNTALYRDAAAVVHRAPAEPAELEALAARMKAGKVAVAIHLGTNPVATLPKGFGYEEALKAVPYSLALALAADETARRCTLTLPAHHAFESWGDHMVRSGVVSLQQPVIAPLYDSRQKEAALLAWIDPAKPFTEDLYHAYLMRRWERDLYAASGAKAGFRAFWNAALHDGVMASAPAAAAPRTFAAALPAPPAPADGFVVALTEGFYTGDGSHANNGWLQELPHPVSKVVWDNYAAVAPATARELGVGNNDLVEVKTPAGAVTLPVVLQPGQAERFIAVALGYGRTDAGPIGNGVGVDVTPILPKDGARVVAASVAKAAGSYEVVSTQEHHALDDEFTKELHLRRRIVQEGTVEEYRRNPHFLHEKKHELFDIAPTVTYQGLKWAMAVDLNKCIGCNACVAGCNVENNIPVVGKDQVKNGREMMWLRIDRYYAGTDADPAVSHQPMLCQHCDNAPCENVCPVAATNHSPDGLNQMAYNRCVGTKYCSNNCPYKVRRFNFFDWRDHVADGFYETEPAGLVNNPEVTVRSRGVMEKCTFCVQRIMEARQHAAEEGRPLKGSDVKTACQEACPASAIVFGDMNDPASAVAAMRKHDLGYHVLEEINARPNVTYVARLRNVHGEPAA